MNQADFNQLIRLIVMAFGYHGESGFEIRQTIIQSIKVAICEKCELAVRALESNDLNEREKEEVLYMTYAAWIGDQFNPDLNFLIRDYHYPTQLAEHIQIIRSVIESRGL